MEELLDASFLKNRFNLDGLCVDLLAVTVISGDKIVILGFSTTSVVSATFISCTDSADSLLSSSSLSPKRFLLTSVFVGEDTSCCCSCCSKPKISTTCTSSSSVSTAESSSFWSTAGFSSLSPPAAQTIETRSLISAAAAASLVVSVS